MRWKCCTKHASKFGKLSSGYKTGKCWFSFQSPRKAMPKNVQTTALISHTSKTENENESCSVVSDSLRPHGLYSPWNSPGHSTGMGSHSLLQGIFPTQGSNPGLPHCRQNLYQLNQQGSSNASKVTLKIIHAMFQQCVN